jgi:tRNA threonylcarbamoyladenosine biosynthesis protein TsaB
VLILASDTSGPSVSVALWTDGRLLGMMTQNVGLTHSVTFLPLIERLLQACKRSIAEVDLFAATVGPGSFTGIRIGISAVKAMAYAAKKPAIGVSTLAALAWPYRGCPDLLVCPMLDARNGRVFAGAWQDGDCVLAEENQLMTDFLAHAAAFADPAASSDGSVICEKPHAILLLGCPVPDPVWASLPSGPVFRIAPVSSWLPQAAAVAEIAALTAGQGAPMDPQNLEANYLSASAAERLQKRKT